ncbi:hypothetical protein [Streptomyces sp. NPDC090080]|uniref:hypothetical protein n=1 Tax=Streptomyces sp. NPDC090080 TaxID=3365939 RepID=UPI00382FB80D
MEKRSMRAFVTSATAIGIALAAVAVSAGTASATPPVRGGVELCNYSTYPVTLKFPSRHMSLAVVYPGDTCLKLGKMANYGDEKINVMGEWIAGGWFTVETLDFNAAVEGIDIHAKGSTANGGAAAYVDVARIR